MRRFAILPVLPLLAAGAMLLGPSPAAGGGLLGTPLHEAARREGTVVLWGPPTDTVDKHYVQEFQRAFPGLTVRAVADTNTPQKLLTEALAGRHEADVVWWPVGGLLPLAQRDLLARLEPEGLAAAGLGPDDLALDGRALKVANVIYTVEYDTRRLRREELPRTWEDLLAPRWQGRIVGATLLVPGVPATIGMLRGEAAALAFARALRDTARVTMVPSSAVAREMLHRGEKDLMISLVSEVLKRKHQYREPVDWAPISPTYATQHVVAVLARAPHPGAARLFALWAASAAGKVAMEKASFDADARPGAPTELARLVREAGLELLIEDAQNAGPRAVLYRKAREILLGETR